MQKAQISLSFLAVWLGGIPLGPHSGGTQTRALPTSLKMQKAQISLSFCAVWLGRHSGGTRTREHFRLALKCKKPRFL
ncbi:hypothetical protein SAMN04487996_1273 [Dyadobacter soli]|uniref:Uncharacterized protein n=1 Tax=Dyadobacter soli TaxID=659014 RepID=A0A1G7YXJ6_9BACT|nr:hypothetical protein SAMN04487996_1273 [Dyadobacter soli]